MKCIPMTLSGLEVTAAILVMEIELVFVAKIAFGFAASSICLKIFNFSSRFSVAASTIRSLSLTPAAKSVNVSMFANVSALSFSVIFSFLIIRSKFFEITTFAFSRASSEMSIR